MIRMHSAVLSILILAWLASLAICAVVKSDSKSDDSYYEKERSYEKLHEFEEGAYVTGSGHGREKRTAVSEEAHLWPNATIRYVLTDAIERDTVIREAIEKAIDHWHQRTCIRFIRHSIKDRVALEKRERLVEFVKGERCYSVVGRRGETGSQNVSISDGCASPDPIVHELGHLVGLWHEQARYDRDSHVIILLDNVRQYAQFNFDKQKSMNLLSPYDLSSIMHYDLKTFSANGKDAIQPILEDLAFLVKNRRELSFYDGQNVHKLYKCAAHCGQSAPKCVNGGYLDKDCKCVCPAMLIGQTCESVQTDKVCGGVLEVRGKVVLRSPDYPRAYPESTNCTWLIKSAPGTVIYLHIENMDLEKMDSEECNDFLEIRYHYIGIDSGPRICGNQNDLKKRNYTSTTNRMIIRFKSDADITGKGFQLVAKTLPRQNCASNPCKNGGVCHELPEAETYYCECPTDKWIGQNCHLEIVDGTWSDWSSWSGCAAKCGHEHRRRTCIQPLNGGKNCTGGPMHESRRCSSQSLCNGHFYCDFGTASAKEDCGLIQEVKDDKMDWVRMTGSTLSSKTGPEAGHTTGSPDDAYYYLEGNDGNSYQNAIVWLPNNTWKTDRFCLQFHYHMYGEWMGALRVLRKTKHSTIVIWQASACHGDRWLQANINVMLYKGVGIGFEAVRGDSPRSDIAIDDISISPGGCSEELVIDGPAAPRHSNGKRSKAAATRQRRVRVCAHNNRSQRVGEFNYTLGCQRFNCFCNQNGKADCPPWKVEDICPKTTRSPLAKRRIN